MAGPVRQPIDIPSLERYVERSVPELKTSISVKQVSSAAQSTLRSLAIIVNYAVEFGL